MLAQNFKWSEEQLEAIDRLIKFTTDDEKVLVLTGFAGVGKTAVMNEFVQYLDSNEFSFILCAPTHKAKFVLEQATGGYPTMTLHSLLSLSPNLDIFHLDLKDLQFESGGLGCIPYRGIVIVDEASMVNDELYDLLLEQCSKRQCKIVFICDIAQIRPVNNKDLSKVFNNTNIIRLTKIFRQDSNTALSPILLELRETPMSNFDTVIGESGSLYTYSSAKEFTLKAVEQIKIGMKDKNINHTKIIAYTNNRVQAFNDCVRRIIYNDDNPYHIGEILTGADNFQYNQDNFFNSSDYIILSAQYTERKIPGFIKLPGYLLTLYDSVDKIERKVFIIDAPNINRDYLDSLAQTIENIRIDAILSNKRGNKTAAKFCWKKYYDMQKSFASPVHLMFDNRVIKSKTFTYGYAITAHKSQGSSYNNVFVDMHNLFLDKDKTELRQLQYVALSRTKTDAHILL